jgi:hypothetical protein
MKALIKYLCLLAIFVFAFQTVYAQKFDTYFENKTLRIDYLHSGTLTDESIELKKYWEKPEWQKTKNQLIDTSHFGSTLFSVYDSATNNLIFSKSYCTLFGEYRTTEKGRETKGDFEECITFPKPKNTIQIVIESTSRHLEKTTVFTSYLNPKITKFEAMNKGYNVLDLHVGGRTEECFNILIVPDGYANSDVEKLKTDVQKTANYILNCSPFDDLAKHINIRAVEGFSADSGITNPNASSFKNTLLGVSFNVIDLDRYLMCENVWKLHEIADDAPYDAILILANTAKYGGGGIYNFYATVYSDGDENTLAYVTVHELGHSIAGLADEYYSSEVSVQDFFPLDVEPVEPNLTTMVNFDKKWKSMLSEDTPVPTPAEETYKSILGVFEGGGYCAKGVYRPYMNCTMKDKIYNNFCPVCKKVIRETILKSIK